MRRWSLAIAGVSSLVSGLLLVLLLGLVGDGAHYPYQVLEEGWRLRGTVRGPSGIDEHVEEEAISIKSLPQGGRGDYFQISRELPDMGDIPFPTLMFETCFSAYELSVGSVVVDRFEMEAVGTPRFVGSTYHLVTLPEVYAGKYVTVTVYRRENQAGRAISPPYIGAHSDLEAMLLRRNFFSLGCGFFLMVFGLSFLFLTLLYLNGVPELATQLASSLLCAALGALLVTHEHVAFLFMQPNVGTLIDYLSVYSLLPLGFFLFETMHLDHWLPDRVYRGMFAVSIVASGIFYALHFLDIVHMNRLLGPYYILVVVGMSVLVVDVVRNIRGKKLTSVSLVTLMGLGTMIVCLLLHTLFQLLWRFGMMAEWHMGRYFLPLGGMCFAASEIVNYLSFRSESGSRQRDYASLQDIAYADALTGLSNRARADKVLEDLERTREDFCLFSIEVNGLKGINADLGHLSGDRLLKDYAQALKASFGEEELCARVGSGEFLVISKQITPESVAIRLRGLYQDLDEMNEGDRTIFRSAAIGYAFRHESPGGDVRAVRLLAEGRMQDNKREQRLRQGQP